MRKEDGFLDHLGDAAVEAEYHTGERELTREEAKSSIIVRVARISGATIIIIIGFALLPLPGPGWLIIAGGFTLLAKDVSWAGRVVHEIRKRVPGIPEDGKIPRSSIITMVVFTGAMTLIGLLWGPEIKDALGDFWNWLF